MTGPRVEVDHVPAGKDLSVNNHTGSKVEVELVLSSGTKIRVPLDAGEVLRLDPTDQDRNGITIEFKPFGWRPKLRLV